MPDELLNQINKKIICIANGNLPLILINIMEEGLITKIKKIIKKNIGNAKHIFYHNVFKSYKTYMKKTWSMINETLNRKKNKNDLPTEFLVNDHCISNPKIIADSFNTYFVNIGSNLSSKIYLRDHSLSFNNYLTSRTESRFNFSTISVEEVLSIINNNLDNKNSSGYDDISNKLLKSIK